MQTKHFRTILDWKIVNISPVGFQVSEWRCVVFAAVWIHVSVFKVFDTVVLLESSEKTTSIIVVRDSASVVDVTSHED
jgi:hypothetical protein